MKCNVPVAEAISDEAVLPERVQEVLGQLVGAAREGLLALSVEVGLGVLRELLEQEVDELVGPKGKWNPGRTAVRHGHELGEVTLDGRRVQVKRLRARTADGESEVPLATYEHFADRDRLGEVMLERMVAGAAPARTPRTAESAAIVAETHLILPVPVAEPLVGAHRARFDPVARAGVPAHITVLGPFAAQDTLTSRDLDALDELFGVTPPIVFRLARVARFAHALYLEPEPAEPFVAVTEAVWRRWPDHAPYGGTHRDIVPHLTVAVGDAMFADLQAALEPRLPLAADAREAWLIAQRADGRWETQASLLAWIPLIEIRSRFISPHEHSKLVNSAYTVTLES